MHGTFKKIKTKADPFSLDELISWLEKQPAGKRYCYEDSGKCLLAQWFQFCGKRDACLGNVLVVFNDGIVHHLPESFQNTSYKHPRTFGSALKRARAALS